VRVAFFDVDKTILCANSASLWLRREVALGHVSRWDALRGAFWLLLYALGLARLEQVLADAIRSLRDVDEEAIKERTRTFFHEEVRALIRPEAVAAIAEHRARGDAVYLLTTSAIYMSTLLAEELAIDGYVCNRLLVSNGRFTGEAEAPLCYGEGKVARAAALASTLGVSLADCIFYTDSYSDLPMLLAVGSPIVVTPDLRLRRYAKRRGWTALDWSAASPPRLGPSEGRGEDRV
jgi:HAD superfamily hydrolase (TIGR01490 family)